MTPGKQNGAQAITPERRPNDQMAANDTAHSNRPAGARHLPTQLPIVLAATIYSPAPGMSQALVVPDDVCPGCGFWHSHRIKVPAPVLVNRKARCGQRYELALHKPAAKRGRRAA
ncbi:hypothetical protein [Streptosporangium sandarakinum]|uniref:Uncharacterized protein n=1 Tax=Streptosporangium pseudovulgare TaxID=35765 RepID=A0ABQ2RD68_9ACTN|nr:hypothetical protein GCM10010140_58730 [Streptosporangium pseudovulgare]